jgi:hypothetical protein
MFRPLENSRAAEMTLSREKARLHNRPEHASWLRLYAIKLERGCYIITGGAIKLTRTMQERTHTLRELNKMEHVRSVLLEHGAIDVDGFEDRRGFLGDRHKGHLDIVRSYFCHLHMTERGYNMPLNFGRIINQRCCPDICRLHQQPFFSVFLHRRRPFDEEIIFSAVLCLIVFLAKLLYGLSVHDDQLVIGIHDIRLIILMPVNRYGVKSEIWDSLSRHLS